MCDSGIIRWSLLIVTQTEEFQISSTTVSLEYFAREVYARDRVRTMFCQFDAEFTDSIRDAMHWTIESGEDRVHLYLTRVPRRVDPQGQCVLTEQMWTLTSSSI